MGDKITVIDSQMVKIGDVVNGYTVIATAEDTYDEVTIVAKKFQSGTYEWVVASMRPDADWWLQGHYFPNRREAVGYFVGYIA